MPGMGTILILGIAAIALTYVAVCIWLMVRIYNRGEQWAIWTLFLLFVIFVAFFALNGLGLLGDLLWRYFPIG